MATGTATAFYVAPAALLNMAPRILDMWNAHVELSGIGLVTLQTASVVLMARERRQDARGRSEHRSGRAVARAAVRAPQAVGQQPGRENSNAGRERPRAGALATLRLSLSFWACNKSAMRNPETGRLFPIRHCEKCPFHRHLSHALCLQLEGSPFNVFDA